MKQYGLLKYLSGLGKYNLGDYIQSLAAKQFLPQVDEYICRENLSEYDANQVKMIMNGWYMACPDNWPPSSKIDPLFVSFHINMNVENKMLSEKSINYLKQHEPIGCRDLHTRDILMSAGVDAYFSGCLTLTLGRTYKRTNVNDKILFVNVLEELLTWKDILSRPRSFFRMAVKHGKFKSWLEKNRYINEIFDKDLLKQAEYYNPMIEEGQDQSYYFKKADEYLKELASAKFVVTSKIHTALPCLAIGTPVIFINGGLYDKANVYRLGGLVDMMNQVIIDKKGNISTNFDIKLPITADSVFENPTRHVKYANELAERCRKFIAE